MISNPRIITVDSVEEAMREISAVGACGAGVRAMADKARFYLIRLDNVPAIGANILKQEMLSKGGEAAVSKGSVDLSDKYSSVLLMGTMKQFKALIAKLKLQQFKLPAIGREIEHLLNRHERNQMGELSYGGHRLEWGKKTYVMGILNVTPDSFSDGGQFNSVEAAVARAKEMAAQGADIIDIGAESLRPGHGKLSEIEEAERLFPVLEKILKVVHIPISIDTTKAVIARKALSMGAVWINDVSGPEGNTAMAQLAAETGAPIILMHNRVKAEYKDLMAEIIADLRHMVDAALAAGVRESQLILDPGIGFGKTPEHNLIVMKRMKELTGLGYPLLVGTSRKSFIGKALDLPVDDRLEGTAATVSLAIEKGADIIRVHDVREMKRVAAMSDHIVRLQEA